MGYVMIRPDRISYSILVKDVFVATHQSPQPVDVNQDLNVDILDLVEVAGSIGMVPGNPRADVNGDGLSTSWILSRFTRVTIGRQKNPCIPKRSRKLMKLLKLLLL